MTRLGIIGFILRETLRSIILLIILVTTVTISFAQSRTQKNFIVPAGSAFLPGAVRVKIKKEQKEQFDSGLASLRTVKPLVATPLVSAALAKKGAAWNGPLAKKHSVDITLFFTLRFDATISVENYIDQLYATGLFDIVEPVYLPTVSFVPNDDLASNQYYLSRIHAFEAWDVTQGSKNITIAIVDSGGDLDHPDLAGNLYTNSQEIPDNNLDDDNDGYIDNYRGWDFVGGDTLNTLNSDFKGDNDPSIHSAGNIRHGTMSAGCASASTNNAVGISGVGFNTTIMFTKHTADNQKTQPGYLYNTMEGVLYAANQGIQIINCSFGGTTPSQIEQELFNHITIDLGCLVVAAAGNSGDQSLIYPAAYDNVLSIAATDSDDKAAFFTNFGSTIDLAAPGVGIYTTSFDDTYATVQGTSFSSPIVAGAAALVWSKFPSYTGLQIGELLRLSADADALYSVNPTFNHTLGSGRLDIAKALNTNSPSLRASNAILVNSQGEPPRAGEQAALSFDFVNFLATTTANVLISLSVESPYATVNGSEFHPGTIGTLQKVNSSAHPFTISLADAVPENLLLDLNLTYSDGNYFDTQTVTIILNPSWLDLSINKISTSFSNTGRIGFQDPANAAKGLGFIFREQELLFEMGLLMGNSQDDLYNNIRGSAQNSYDNDFVPVAEIKRVTPSFGASAEIAGAISNSDTTALQKYVIGYKMRAWTSSSLSQFVVVEYEIVNSGTTAIDDFHFGIFADWDITPQKDAVAWSAENKMGFAYPGDGSANPSAGIQVLNGSGKLYAIDNDPNLSGNPFGVYDGFSDSEKFTALTQSRETAGTGDVSMVVSSGPWTIDAGNSITVAFALHAAENPASLKLSAVSADSLYQSISAVTGFENRVTEFQVFPNPVTRGLLILSGPAVANASVSIENLQGEVLQTAPLVFGESRQQNLNVENLNDGFYLVVIQSNRGRFARKIVILKTPH